MSEPRYPDPKEIVEQVCRAINANAASIYTPHCMKVVPINPDDVMNGMGKVRPHSDARAFSAIIFRKHYQVPVGFGEYKAPTYAQIRSFLVLASNTSGLQHRMVTMCELMRKQPAYRKVYIDAVSGILKAGYDLCAVQNIEHELPCK